MEARFFYLSKGSGGCSSSVGYSGVVVVVVVIVEEILEGRVRRRRGLYNGYLYIPIGRKLLRSFKSRH